MKQQLLETWTIHHKMNILLLNNITDSGLQKTLSSRGGRTVYQQWVHIRNVRMQWLEVCAKDIFKKYQILDKEAPVDRKKLLQSLTDSAKGIEELLSRSWDDNGKARPNDSSVGRVKCFKKGVIPLLGYFISHESHHRGSILLTLKQCGEKIPDTVKWGIWEWEK